MLGSHLSRYTNKGVIIVRLSLSDLDGVDEMQKVNEKLLTVSIEDTGKGIASKYLRESLYKREDLQTTFHTATKQFTSFQPRGRFRDWGGTWPIDREEHSNNAQWVDRYTK